MRNDDAFEDVWKKSLELVVKTGSDEPKLPRNRKRTQRFENGSDAFHHEDPKSHYRCIYFEVIDSVTAHMSRRIEEKGIGSMQQLRKLFARHGWQSLFLKIQ